MKTDTIEFDTKKDINQIVNALKSLRKANIQKLNDDPFGNVGGVSPDIAVLVDGKASIIDNLKHISAGGRDLWGVQVYVTDMGSARHVELVALGENGLAAALSQSYRYTMAVSRDYRDKIAQMIA
ncbi:MAG: hypothetical protein NC313_15285 [Butyrivibrio sp.]|nr:hypothetical protein [Butyrivibrio sp.]